MTKKYKGNNDDDDDDGVVKEMNIQFSLPFITKHGVAKPT